MKLGIDISQIVYEGTGVSRFVKGLVGAILEYDKDNDWTFFFSGWRKTLDPDIERAIKQKGYKLVKWKLPPTFLSFLWNDLHFKFSTNLDWFITSDWTEPKTKNNKATIVHDLTYLRYPETVDKKILAVQSKRLDWVKKESRIIFADSQSTKRDLIDLLKIDESKIVVNYPGVKIQKSAHEPKKNKSFILTVGKIEPRKNLQRLIEAFELADLKNLKLIIVGPPGWDKIKSTNKSVEFTGYVSDEELAGLYSSCLFFIYPSLYEGFGYPMVEAMKLGAPVAASNTSSLAEIGNGAALLFDPHNVQEIKKAIETLANDEKLRKELVKKGRQRAKQFTWKSYFNKMISSLKIE